MLKPICVSCQRFFRPKKTGYYFTEGMPATNSETPPGKEFDHLWRPYKVWCGDLWECQGCGIEIVVGAGSRAIAELHHVDFTEVRKKLHADQFNVNDC
jgi:hypothetical protein